MSSRLQNMGAILETLRLKPTREQLLRFGLSLVLGVLLWGWVTQLQNPYAEQVYLDMQVRTDGLPGDLQIVSSLPNAAVTVGGARSEIGLIRRAQVDVTLDLDGIDEPGTYRVALVPDTPEARRVTVEPEEVTIRIEERVFQTFPVQVMTEDVPGAAQTITNVQPTVTQVSVSGARSAVERIHQVVLPIEAGQNTQSFSQAFDVLALDEQGQLVSDVNISPASIIARVEIETVGKQVAVIPNVIGTPAEGYAVQVRRVIPDTIIVQGPADALADLLFINTEVVDISDASEPVAVDVGLSALPEGVHVVEPADGIVEVRVAIEDATASSQVLPDLPLEWVGLGSGLDAVADPNTISITVSAPASILQSMTADDIHVYLDLTDLEPGTHLIEPVTTVPQGATWIDSEPTTIEVTIVDTSEATPASDEQASPAP